MYTQKNANGRYGSLKYLTVVNSEWIGKIDFFWNGNPELVGGFLCIDR